MTEQEMREVFREMREEPVPADSLARARMAVERRVGQRRWWKFAVPLVAASCIVAGFLWLRPVKPLVRVVEPAPVEIAQAQPQPQPEITVRTAPKPGRVRPRPAETVPSMLIRIETPDPDVVILLVN